MSKKLIDFDLGFLPENKEAVIGLLKERNLVVKHEFDDPHGYYTFIINGTWDDYSFFLDNPIQKSLTHYEDD